MRMESSFTNISISWPYTSFPRCPRIRFGRSQETCCGSGAVFLTDWTFSRQTTLVSLLFSHCGPAVIGGFGMCSTPFSMTYSRKKALEQVTFGNEVGPFSRGHITLSKRYHPHKYSVIKPEAGGSRFLRNVGNYLLNNTVSHPMRPRGSIVGWGTMLQAGRSRDRVPVKWFFFFQIYLFLPAALWPWGPLSL
jgi:hypothetical protein